jgi:hypothetical protein
MTLKPVFIIAMIAVAMIGVMVPSVFAEEYFYIPHHKLETPPIFCAMEFDDQILPSAQAQLMEITKNAVFDWKTKLIDTTGEQMGWNFQFQRMSIEQQQELFFDHECTVNIYFERQPPIGEWDIAGYADSYGTLADIQIFYLEPIYNNNEWSSNKITGFKNTLTFDLHDTIRHEIGHALGLDHPNLPSYMFTKQNNSLQSPSIMIDEWQYDFQSQINYKITDYDVRSVINLYGEDGINEINISTTIEFLVIGVILMVVIYFISRKFRSKNAELVPFDTSDDKTTRCMRCNRIISNKNNICYSCKRS